MSSEVLPVVLKRQGEAGLLHGNALAFWGGAAALAPIWIFSAAAGALPWDGSSTELPLAATEIIGR